MCGDANPYLSELFELLLNTFPGWSWYLDAGKAVEPLLAAEEYDATMSRFYSSTGRVKPEFVAQKIVISENTWRRFLRLLFRNVGEEQEHEQVLVELKALIKRNPWLLVEPESANNLKTSILKLLLA